MMKYIIAALLALSVVPPVHAGEALNKRCNDFNHSGKIGSFPGGWQDQACSNWAYRRTEVWMECQDKAFAHAVDLRSRRFEHDDHWECLVRRGYTPDYGECPLDINQSLKQYVFPGPLCWKEAGP
jgi:hypothetical protein